MPGAAPAPVQTAAPIPAARPHPPSPSPQGGTLWLHVGTHKTGTTSIQRALRLREGALREAGLRLYPQENAWGLANLFIRAGLRTTPRVAEMTQVPDLAGFRHELAAEHWQLGGADMVASSEEFCLLRETIEAHALLSTLGQKFARIVPILVLRNDADWRASRRDQLSKSGMWELQKALPDAASTDGEWYYDRAALLAFWRAIGPVQVIDYDAALATQGSILPPFAAAIEQPGLFDDLDLRLNRRSTS
ncbi:hypothetical protein [Salipiger mangrovisoli]|uniref:Sulfotransferase family protein n=1 Tax=Salipiger mangrovisoli TaxID=2865933 RepID=A0ABR9X9H1_9RHOB|nr:hypothetical protein [Salipiger mangrovisoli]MBE9640254.1 hypothetical protein [Salipiger mangrovisoli]